MKPVPEKPKECICPWPNQSWANPTGHSPNCPVFRNWYVKQAAIHGDPRNQDRAQQIDPRQKGPA